MTKGDKDRDDWVRVLDKLEARIEKVKVAYQRYFEGLERREPVDERLALQRAVRRLVGRHTGNTQLRYRLQMLVDRFNSYNNMWERMVGQIDAGTFRPHQFRADLRVGPADARKAAASKSTASKGGTSAAKEPGNVEPLKALYDRFIESRKSTGESTNIPYDKFAGLIEKQRPALESKVGGRPLEFRVVVENGRTKLKGAPGK